VCQCQRVCHVIGKEITEQLEFIPARLYVKQHIRYKYACSLGCEVKIAPLPPQPIDKAIAGAGLLADVLISKYQDAMPLYRQSLRFKRHHVEIPNSTLCDWVGYSADRLQPIVFALQAELLKHKKLHTDDTTVPVLAKGKTKQGRLWVYVADGSFGYKATVYDYTPTRSQRGPQAFLAGFSGYLQADAYAGYDVLYQSGDVVEVGCLAHARRKFYEIAQTVKGESHAQDAVIKIGEIYAIEAKIRNTSQVQRYYYRKKHLKPLYRKLHRWLVKKQKKTLDKTPIRQAINYALNHWRALQNVLAHGSLEVDNNLAERAIKPVVIGRKNYLFAGGDEGGKRAAIIYSLIETCKQNDINTFDYLRDVLTRLPTHKANKIRELLPYYWQPKTI
jgi:transposase